MTEHRRIYMKAWREANKDAVREYEKSYRKTNQDRRRLSTKAYRERNKHRVQKWSESYRDRHPNVSKTWYEANRARVSENGKRYRSTRKAQLREAERAWRLANKERKAAYRRAYYLEHRDEQIQYAKMHRATHINEWRQWHADYAAKNREALSKKNAQWAKNNKEYLVAYRRDNAASINARTARRRAMQLMATPAWANHNIIRSFYEDAVKMTELTGICYEVDHIYPLQGATVCGLHVEYNLQLLTKKENVQKGNKMPSHVAHSPASIAARLNDGPSRGRTSAQSFVESSAFGGAGSAFDAVPNGSLLASLLARASSE